MLVRDKDIDLELEINDHSRTPKYRQIISEINYRIEKGVFQYGHKLPSINTLSEGFLLSRNTVEKAYVLLKEEGIIEAVKGKGYFVKNTQPLSKVKVMCLINSISDYNKEVIDTIGKAMIDCADITLHMYHGDLASFTKLLRENRDEYHYFIVFPRFKNESKKEIKEALNTIPCDRLILLDYLVDDLGMKSGQVYQDYKLGFYSAMLEQLELAKKYEKLIMTVPGELDEPWVLHIVNGFRRFCSFHGFEFDVLPSIDENYNPRAGEALITLSDGDIIAALNKLEAKNLVLGSEYGILSCIDNPIKNFLGSGISVIAVDYYSMGHLAASMIKSNKLNTVKNDFKFIERGSF